MNQLKIGRFIAECRKKRHLTQMQLAERLGITDRAVSKWENGRSMPDSSLMLDLCQALNITVNDLLSGEVVTVEHYSKELEHKLLELIREKEESDRRLLKLELWIGGLSCVVILGAVLMGLLFPFETEWMQTAVILFGMSPGVVGLFLALRLEQIAGYYECQACGHRYVPTYRAVNLAPHLGRTRRMRCPVCGKKSWQKKVLSRE